MCVLSVVTTCAWRRAQRLEGFFDQGTCVEKSRADVEPVDRLKFKDSKKYKDRLSAAQKATGEKDALVAMRGEMKGMDLVAVAFDFRFMGGSMGAVVGERFVQAANICLEHNIPLICFSASGGARVCKRP